MPDTRFTGRRGAGWSPRGVSFHQGGSVQSPPGSPGPRGDRVPCSRPVAIRRPHALSGLTFEAPRGLAPCSSRLSLHRGLWPESSAAWPGREARRRRPLSLARLDWLAEAFCVHDLILCPSSRRYDPILQVKKPRYRKVE